MKEILSDLGMAIVMAVIGIGLISLFLWFVGQISVMASAQVSDTAYLICGLGGAMSWS